jgi:hypothetical protein
MTSRTRRFLLGSSLVVLLGLATGLVAYYNGNLPMMRSSAGPVELAYLPPDTTAVAYADVRTIMDSEFRQKLRKVLPSSNEKDEIQRELGVDIERDIDSVVAGYTGGDPATGGGIVIIRGRFNETTIENLAMQHGAKIETYKGRKLILHDGLASRDAVSIHGEGAEVSVSKSTGGVVFLEPGLLGLGDAAALRQAIDASTDQRNVTSNAEVMGFIAEAERAGNAWVIGKFDAIARNAEIPDEVKSHMPGVQWFLASTRVNGGVTGTLRADATDDKAAEDLRQIVNGGLAAARLMSGKDPQIEAMLRSLQVTGTGKTVGVSFTISPEMLDTIVGLAGLGAHPSAR